MLLNLHRIPSAPADLEFTFEFESTANDGAFLIAAPMVYMGYASDSPFIIWMKGAGREMVTNSSHSKDIQKHGLCLITEVYRTTHCKAVVAADKGQKVTMGVSADAFDGAKLTAKGSWGSAAGCSVEQEFGKENSVSLLHLYALSTILTSTTQDDVNVTVFVGGLKFQPYFFNVCISKMIE
jgi:hypothetical protein